MSDVLFPYQKIGADWLASRKTALLADDMGLGKSAQAITACDAINAKRVLVLCPASARVNWTREFEKFSIFDRESLVVQTKKFGQVRDLTVCSFDIAIDLAAKSFSDFDVLILDECHFLKSTTAKRTKAVFGKNGLVRRAKRVWAISGTPAPNHPGELWPMLFSFGVTSLSHEQFIRRYCTYFENAFGLQISGAREETIPELRSLLAKTMLRRKKEDVMKQLPPIFFTDEVVEPGPVDLDITTFISYTLPVDRRAELAAELKAQEELVEKTLALTEKQAAASIEAIKNIEALAQSVSTIRKYIGIQKVEPVGDMILEELVTGRYEKLVIFAIHHDVIEGLKRKLRKFNPVTLYGTTPPRARQKNVDRFQKDPKCCVFIGNIRAAGTAITLTAAHNVIFIEQDWVPGNNAQAAMRCHRIGQTKPVFVRFVGLANSMDSRVSQVLRKKAADLAKIFDDRELPESKRDDTPAFRSE